MEYPKLRQVEAIPLYVRGRTMIMLRDPLGFCKDSIIVSTQNFFIISMFDGKHSISEIQVAYTRKFGDILFSDKIKEIVADLDSKYLLESDKFNTLRRKIEKKFRGKKKIKNRHSGVSYPDDPRELTRKLGEYFSHIDEKGESSKTVCGVIAPHIDFQRGGILYAKAYQPLRNSEPPDLFILFGTSHSPTKNLFVGTSKNFETPLGEIKTDIEIMKRIARNFGHAIYEDELLFIYEHSLDFQLVFLQYLFGKSGKEFRIVPLLCGSFDEIMREGKSPSNDAKIREMSTLLRKEMQSQKGRICLIAGADLAHVGMKFGDPCAPSPGTLATLAEDDKKMLEYVAKADAEGFYRDVSRDNDKRRICGLSPIYMLLTLLQGHSGVVHGYTQCLDPDGHSVVTITAVSFS